MVDGVRKILLSVLLLPAAVASAGVPVAEGDTAVAGLPPRYGFAVYANPGRLVATDGYVSRWLKRRGTVGVGAELTYTSLPCDSSAYARDYGYPTFAFGVRYTFNGGVSMHREADEAWGQLQPVDYDSPLGDFVSLYAAFHRPLVRTRHWEADYTLGLGLAYTATAYNKDDDIDNELIGTHLNCYFNAGVHVTYHFVPQWGIKVGVDLVHHSNGALDRPNKGSNAVGPTVGVVYTPYYAAVAGTPATPHRLFRPFWYVDMTAGVGAKTLDEEWQTTQFGTSPDDADYRKEHFRLYAAYSLQAALMRRYARRWASGLGLDIFYGSYYSRVRDIVNADGGDEHLSPWSVAVAARHEVYYGRWSAPITVGYYLSRHMGSMAEATEKRYYERVGVKYNIPLHRRGDIYTGQTIAVGISLNAHAFKANFTELALSVPIRL